MENHQLSAHRVNINQDSFLFDPRQLTSHHIKKAILNEDLKYLKLWLDNKNRVDEVSEEKGVSVLYYAASLGKIQTVQFLLKCGANCNVKTREGDTPLHCAVKKTYHNIATMLIKAGADVNARNNIGETPLHLACKTFNKAIVALLVNAGADVNVTDFKGNVPCFYVEEKYIGRQPLKVFSMFSLIEHLVKLKEAGLYMHINNIAIYDKLLEDDMLLPFDLFGNSISSPLSDEIKKIESECYKEIMLMKKLKFNGLICFDVLKKLDKPLNVATEAEISLLATVIYEERFPTYHVIFGTQLKYAAERKFLLEQAQECFSNIVLLSENKLPLVPEEIGRYIMSNLNNYELGLFVKNIKTLWPHKFA